MNIDVRIGSPGIGPRPLAGIPRFPPVCNGPPQNVMQMLPLSPTNGPCAPGRPQRPPLHLPHQRTPHPRFRPPGPPFGAHGFGPPMRQPFFPRGPSPGRGFGHRGGMRGRGRGAGQNIKRGFDNQGNRQVKF